MIAQLEPLEARRLLSSGGASGLAGSFGAAGANFGGIRGQVWEVPTILSPPLRPLAGRAVFLDLNHNGRRDPREPATTTDASGRYAFTGLVPGTYRVTQVFPRGWRPTPHAGKFGAFRLITVFAGTVQEPINFGSAVKPGGRQAATIRSAAPALAPSLSPP